MNYLLSCDWGTSRFRMHLVNIITGEVLAGISNPNGIQKCHAEWKLAKPLITKEEHYTGLIKGFLKEMQDQSGISLEGLPIYISGMASSSLGLCELPYVKLPFHLTNASSVLNRWNTSVKLNNPVFLTSGLCTENDVMRGEEIQCIGWHTGEYSISEQTIFILPGTHSKHITIRKSEIIGFQTYMTGELFQLLSQASILGNSTGQYDPTWNIQAENSFRKGVRCAVAGNLFNELFKIRGMDLLRTDRSLNYFHYLSGLLIGTELRGLKDRIFDHIVFACQSGLTGPYRAAVDEIILERTEFLQPEVTERLCIRGHLHLFKNN